MKCISNIKVLLLFFPKKYKYKKYKGFLVLNSLALRVSFYLQMQEVYLSHKRFISCLQGDREEGQSIPLALVTS